MLDGQKIKWANQNHLDTINHTSLNKAREFYFNVFLN